jgi:hypothetical protein
VLGLVGQVGVARRGQNRVVPEVFLHLDQINAGLDQVGGTKILGSDSDNAPIQSFHRASRMKPREAVPE